MTSRESLGHKRCLLVAEVIVALLTATYAPSNGHAQEFRAACRDTAKPRFYESACPDVVRASIDDAGLTDIQCGFVDVPDSYRRRHRKATTLKSFVLIARTQAEHPRTPVFFLTGGPGQSLTSIAGQVITTGVVGQLRLQRDIVLIDPRGVGQSEPRLTCPRPSPLAGPPTGDPGTEPLSPAQRAAAECADAISAQGVDLAQYNTPNLARDLNSIRRALQLPKVVLYGVSYGAFLGLQTMRHAKRWIESAVLVSMPRPSGGTLVRSGQSMQGALDVFAQSCKEHPACVEHGDLTANLDALFTQLMAQPLDLGAESPTGQPLLLTANLLGVFVQQALSDPMSASTLPKAVAGAIAGETDLWLPRVEALAVQPMLDLDLVVSVPVHNSIWCSEELIFGSVEELDARAALSSPLVQRSSLPAARAEYETCAVWPVPAATPRLYAPVVTDIPTYLISGALDPVTPPEFARLALRHLSNGQLTVVAAAGHLASEFSPCAPLLVEQFLDAPYEPVEDSCAEVPVQFVP